MQCLERKRRQLFLEDNMMFDNQMQQLNQFREYTHSRGAKSLAELKHTMNLSWLDSKDYQIVNRLGSWIGLSPVSRRQK